MQRGPPGGPSQALPTPPLTRQLILEFSSGHRFARDVRWQTAFAITESADAAWQAGTERGVLDAHERALFDAAYDAALAAVVREGGIRHQRIHCLAMPMGSMRLTIGGSPIHWGVPCGDGPIDEVKALMDLARAFAGDRSMRYTYLHRPDTGEKHAEVIVIDGAHWTASGPDGMRTGTVSAEDLAKLHALARAAAFTLTKGARAKCKKPTAATRQELSVAPYGELRWARDCSEFLAPSSAELIAFMQAITRA